MHRMGRRRALPRTAVVDNPTAAVDRLMAVAVAHTVAADILAAITSNCHMRTIKRRSQPASPFAF